MLSVSFLYPYKSFSVSAKFVTLFAKFTIILEIRGRGNFKCSLLLVVYERLYWINHRGFFYSKYICNR